MKALGLGIIDFEAHAAHKKQGSSSSSSSGATSKKPPSPKRKREAERKSSRIAGEAADSQGLGVITSADYEDDGADADHWGKKARSEREIQGSADDHALAEAEHLKWAGHQGKATIVGTASYQHTLMRVRTMTEKALGNRVRAIERAKGKHAVTKMRLFARVLCLEGYDDLAEEAKDALERLIEKLGDPGEELEGETQEETQENTQERETQAQESAQEQEPTQEQGALEEGGGGGGGK